MIKNDDNVPTLVAFDTDACPGSLGNPPNVSQDNVPTSKKQIHSFYLLASAQERKNDKAFAYAQNF